MTSNQTDNRHIGTINHPIHGEYHLYFNPTTGGYGISKGAMPSPAHCGYASLAAMLQMKGL